MLNRSRTDASRTAARAPEGGSFSIIAQGVTISGNLSAGNDLQVNGEVEGDIRCVNLTIGETGRVVGAIIADEVVIAGKAEGPITAAKVELLGTAQVSSDMRYEELRVELGAKVSGQLYWGQENTLKLVTTEEREAG